MKRVLIGKRGCFLLLGVFMWIWGNNIGFTEEKPIAGLVACWHFDEGGGTVCQDSVDATVTGIFHGSVSWGEVAKGTAVSKCAVVFNSTPTEGQWVDFGRGNGKWDLENKQSLTIMCCFKSFQWKDVWDQASPMAQKYEWGMHAGWMLGSRTTDEVGIWLMNRPDNQKQEVLSATISGSKISPNKWHHACGVIDQEKKELRFYLDGKLKTVASIPEKWVMPQTSNFPVLIGHSGLQPGGQPWDYAAFYGAIDEVAIYNRALNDYEIAASVPASIK